MSRSAPHALLVHYANMSYRTGGQKLEVDPKTETVDNAEAMKLFRRSYRKPWVIDEDSAANLSFWQNRTI